MEHLNSVNLIGQISEGPKLHTFNDKSITDVISVDVNIVKRVMNKNFKVSVTNQTFTVRIVNEKAQEMRELLNIFQIGRTVEITGELAEIIKGGKRFAVVLVSQPGHCFDVRLTNKEINDILNPEMALKEKSWLDTLTDIEHEEVCLEEQPDEAVPCDNHSQTVMNEPAPSEQLSQPAMCDNELEEPYYHIDEDHPSQVNPQHVNAPKSNKVKDAFLASHTKGAFKQLETGAVVTGEMVEPQNNAVISYEESPIAKGYNVNSFLN